MSDKKTVFRNNISFYNRYYVRLLKVFIIVIVLSLVIIAVTAYVGNYRTIERNYYAKINDLFSMHQRNLNYELDTMLNVGSQLLSDTNLVQYISSNSGSVTDHQLTLKSFISSLYNRIYLLKNIRYLGIYLPAFDQLIYDKGVESGKSFFEEFAFSGINYKQLNDILNNQGYSTITLTATNSNSEKMLCIIRNSMLNYNKLSIIIFLDTSKVVTKNIDEEGDFFLYNTDTGLVSIEGGDITLPAEALENMTALKTGSHEFSYNNKDYYLTFGYYKPLQWHYGYLAPKSSMNSSIFSYTLWTGILISLLILFGVILAFVLAGVAYKPVKMALSRLQLQKDGTEKGKLDEFELISQNYFDVKNNNTILLKRLEDSKSILKSGYLKDLLYGNQTADPVYEADLKPDVIFKKKYHQVIILDIDELAVIEHKNAGEVTILLKQDIISTTQFYFRKVYFCEVLESGFGNIAVILNYDEENTAILDVINEIQALALEKLNITVTAAVGGVYGSIEGLSASFREALQVMEYKYALGRGKILSMADIEAFSNDTFYYPLEKEKFIINATVNGDFNTVKTALLEIIEDNFGKRSLKPEVRYHLLSALAGTLIRIFHAINLTPQEVFGKNYDIYYEIRDFEDLFLFRNKLVNIYQALCEKALEADCKSEDKLKRKMLDYVDNNYYKYDFSLNDMASSFNLSAPYFSDLFKDRTGENFIDYLIRYRLNKAKELMSDTNLKINEIAVKVGYNNTTSFIRAFKKYEGVSPGKFKEINL